MWTNRVKIIYISFCVVSEASVIRVSSSWTQRDNITNKGINREQFSNDENRNGSPRFGLLPVQPRDAAASRESCILGILHVILILVRAKETFMSE